MIQADARSSRHSELAAFLMSRRTRLLPESCGLPHFRKRRRTPGLRREEVSALAGISTAYYTWIEQGRMFDVSAEVLDAIAGALQLNEIETAHLFTLGGKAVPRPPQGIDCLVAWQGAILEVVRLFDGGPAFVLAPWLDVVEANDIARETLGVQAGSNFAEVLFCDEGAVTYLNAAALAGALVALLRRNHIADIENGCFHEIISRIRSRSVAFEALWEGHTVDNAPIFEVDIERAGAGTASFRGVIASDPIAARAFALFMNRLSEKGASDAA